MVVWHYGMQAMQIDSLLTFTYRYDSDEDNLNEESEHGILFQELSVTPAE